MILDIGTRRVVHSNLTEHPRSEWTIQQFRNGLPLDGTYRFCVHDRDGIFAPTVDEALRSMSLQILKTPVRAPQANAHCERFIGTVRRECLDWMIPLSERHLRSVLAEWMSHYNGERQHSALGPGLPNDSTQQPALTGHRLPAAHRVVANAVSAACIITTCWNPSRLEILRSTGMLEPFIAPIVSGELQSAQIDT